MTRAFEFRLWKLQRERRRLALIYSKRYRQAKQKRESQEELERIRSEASWDDQLTAFEIESLVTWELVKRADHLFIPIPERSDAQHWKEGAAGSSHLLTPFGVSWLRDAIREEEKKRREALIAYLDIAAKLVVMATGLIGATIGLVSILKK